jgi:hypothetical protein
MHLISEGKEKIWAILNTNRVTILLFIQFIRHKKVMSRRRRSGEW